MEKKCRFSYSDIEDSLAISCREENENVRESFMLDDVIISLTGKGKIVGLQIKNFSNMLSDYSIEQDILKNIKEISLIVVPRENSLFIGLKIIANREIKISLGRIFMPQLLAK